MARPAVTKGDVERVVKGVLAAGLDPEKFEIRVESGSVRILPCERVRPQDAVAPNPWDDDLAA